MQGISVGLVPCVYVHTLRDSCLEAGVFPFVGAFLFFVFVFVLFSGCRTPRIRREGCVLFPARSVAVTSLRLIARVCAE